MNDRDRLAHIDLEDLAMLAEGRAADPAVYEHLSQCRTCMAAYADAVRYRAPWLATEQAFAPTREMVSLGLPVAKTPNITASIKGRRSPWSARRRLTVSTAITASLVVTALVMSKFTTAPLDAPDLPPAIREAIESSATEGLVLPGGERGAGARPPTLRGGDFEPLLAAASRAARAYEDGPRTAERAYVAGVGFLLAGRLDVARGFVDEGLSAHPRDARLRLLAADLDYRSSDLGRAEEHLREVLRTRPRDPLVMFDLAIVLSEQGRVGEAGQLLQRAARDDRSPLGQRARRELELLAR